MANYSATQADNAILSADALKIKFEAEAETNLAPEPPVTVTIPEARGLGPRPRAFQSARTWHEPKET
jgi:hypothetical protein